MRIDKRDMGRRVKTARLKRGLTQEDLAAVIGITPTHISHIENGKGGGSLDTFIAIMNTLDLTPNELFCGVVEDVKMPLHAFVALVNNRFFVRCHRSFAVNIHHIREIRSMGNRSWKANLYCPTEHHCYIGAKYYDGLSRSLKRLQGIME